MNCDRIKSDVRAKILSAVDLESLVPYFTEFLSGGAKMLRPLFVYLASKFAGHPPDDKVLNLAAAIELMHCASLIHDDILDEGEIRRNAPCLHLTKGVKTAVLAGDYLLGAAVKLVLDTKNFKAVEIVSRAGLDMTKSEIGAIEKRFEKPDLPEYLARSLEKTSPLFLAAARGAFEIAGKRADEKFLKFTENFALCFQIQDDLNNSLDLEKNKKSSDKSSGIYTLVDIIQGEPSCDKILLAKNFLTKKVRETKTLVFEFPPEIQKDFDPLFCVFEGK